MPVKMPKRAAIVRIPKPPSVGEECFMLQCRAHHLKPEREFRFDATRKWRFDFYFPAPHHIAVEIEGGIWNGGAHTRGKHFEGDCEKYAEAAVQGYRVMRFSTGMVERGEAINFVLRALGVGSMTRREKMRSEVRG